MEKERVVVTQWRELAPLLNDCMEQGVDVTIPVTGTSMLPLLREGRDRVVLTRADAAALKKGDIPLYRRQNGQFVLHRVAAAAPGEYTMLGDAQTRLETGIRSEQILAVAKGIYREGAYHDCAGRGYRLYSKVWLALRIVRPLFLRLYQGMVRIGRKRV